VVLHHRFLILIPYFFPQGQVVPVLAFATATKVPVMSPPPEIFNYPLTFCDLLGKATPKQSQYQQLSTA
jgi:hypothetical protein